MTPIDAASEAPTPTTVIPDAPAHQPAARVPLSLVDLAETLDFAPSWAKGAPGRQIVIQERERPQRSSRDSHPPRRNSGAPGGRRDENSFSGRPQRPPQRPGASPTPSTDRRNASARPQHGRDSDGPMRRERSAADQFPGVRIRFVPDDKRLGVLVRKIHSSQLAYPLRQVLDLLLNKPDACRAKIEMIDTEITMRFHVCRICGLPSMDRDSIVSHIVRKHLTDYFDVEETQTEPPSGSFVCIQRCGLSGTLLGPPNHNSINDKILEVHQSLYPDMPIDAYRRRIETVHDAALIEEWKESARTRKTYRRKEDPEGAPMRYINAVEIMTQEIVARQIQETRRAMLPVSSGESLPDAGLRELLARAWKYEQSQPRSLVFAVKAAFKNMQLNMFADPDGEELICAVRPTGLDPSHAVPVIRDILAFLHAHQGAPRAALMAHLAGLAPASAEADTTVAADGPPENRDAITALAWLVEKGHIIARFDGALYAPVAESVQRPA